jgi:diguanylate cyclase (GGDEF)-like protein/PAS domain S-box-containing protein
MPESLVGLARAAQWIVSSPRANLGGVLAFEWVAVAMLAHEVSGWSWPVSLAASALLLVGITFPLRVLIVRPGERHLAEVANKLETAQVIATERDMMIEILEEAGKRHRAIFDSAPAAVVIVDPETTRPFEFNTAALRLLGYSREEFMALPVVRLFRAGLEDEICARLARAARGAVERFESTCITRAGDAVNVAVETHGVAMGGGLATVCVIQDIGQELQSKQALQATHDKMQSMILELEHRNQAQMTLTQLGGVLQACVSLSEAYAAVARFGKRLFPGTTGALYVYSNSRSDLELVGSWEPPTGGYADRIIPTDCWGLRQGHVYDHSDPSSNLSCEHVGATSNAPYLCLPLTAQGETLGLLHVRFSGTNLADLVALPPSVVHTLAITVSDQITMGIANLRLRDRLHHQSVHDPLTGLYNRRYMEETLQREIPRAARINKPLAVVMADLDHFKTFNDSYGHEAGDAVLAELGHLLKNTVRSSDVACRYGGEEFALVLPDTTLKGTLARMESLRTHVADLRVPYRGLMLGGLTISLGVAILPDHGSTQEDLLRMADKALYHAKRAGRNQVQLAEAPTL